MFFIKISILSVKYYPLHMMPKYMASAWHMQTFLNDINSVDISRRAQLLMQMEEVVQRYKVIYKMGFVTFFIVSSLSD